MKDVKILTILVLGLVFCLTDVGQGTPMGTVFTYQGHLYDANSVANGEYDIQFKLFDDPCEGTQEGSTIDINSLDVFDGYFTVELDFGSGVFDGDARWLEIGVRPGDTNDPNAYTVLSPRQEVMPVPYALQTRGIFADDSGDVGIGTTNPSEKLEISNGSIYHHATGSGEAIKLSKDGVPHTYSLWVQPTYDRLMLVEQQFGRGLRIDSSGNVSINTTGAASGLFDADSKFVVKDTGEVGIGTTSPVSELEVVGSIEADGYTINGVPLGSSSSSYWSASGGDIFYTGGNVGIGTSNPQWLLDIQKAGSDGNPPPACVRIKGYQDDGFPSAYLRLGKSCSDTFGTDAMTGPDTIFGIVEGFGINQSSTEATAAQIIFVQSEDWPGPTYVPGSIVFKTSDGIDEPLGRMIIGSSGTVSMFYDASISGELDVGGTVDATAFLGDGSGLTGVIKTESDPTVPPSIKDGISWSEVSSRPAGLDDGDDVGITSESDPQVGDNDPNYIPKWNGLELVSGTIYDNGNVGIGTQIPDNKLDVNGDAHISEWLHIGEPLQNKGINFLDNPQIISSYNLMDIILNADSDGNPSTATAVFNIFYKSGADAENVVKLSFGPPSASIDSYIIPRGDFGIGTTDPTEKLEVNGTAKAVAFVGDGSGLTNLPVTPDSDWTIISDSNMYSAVSGNVGIGTTDPTEKLEVNGNILTPSESWIGSSSTAGIYFKNGNVGIGTTHTQGTLEVSHDGSAHDFVIHPTTGNVGIGTTDPGTAKLAVIGGNVGIGTINPQGKLAVGNFTFESNVVFNSPDEIQSGSTIEFRENNDWSGFRIRHDTEDNHLHFETVVDGSESKAMIIDRDTGNVGIGGGPGSDKLYVDGYAYATGGWLSPSDLRFKENIKTIDSPVGKIKNIKGVSFEWKTSEYKEKAFPEGRHYGVIAQEVEEILPEIVKEGPDGEKAVSYTELIPILTEAIKEQQEQIESLQSEVKTLQETIQRQERFVMTNEVK